MLKIKGREEEMVWIASAAATLAGSRDAATAVEHADQVLEAFRKRAYDAASPPSSETA